VIRCKDKTFTAISTHYRLLTYRARARILKRSLSICVVGDGGYHTLSKELLVNYRVSRTIKYSTYHLSWTRDAFTRTASSRRRYARNHGVPQIMRIIGCIAGKTYDYGARIKCASRTISKSSRFHEKLSRADACIR